MQNKRVLLIVLDSVGIGALPDAHLYGDEGANTLGHIVDTADLNTPNMFALGLSNLPNFGKKVDVPVCGAYGRMMEKSKGKDTTTGHWEMTGVTLQTPFPTYPNGFPQSVLQAFEEKIHTKVIGNIPCSGTKILEDLGEEHMKTGYPIVYTSADSVFQIAAHEDIVPIDTLYHYCEIAREMLVGEHGVGRVIARPFVGTNKQNFERTKRRKDFSLVPPQKTILDCLKENGNDVLAVGKIEDIFAFKGITKSEHAAGNKACVESMLRFMHTSFNGLCFVNLVDFDMLYGHRRDVTGYKNALETFDQALPQIIDTLTENDLLIITADHGCDPTYKGTDHTREYVPLLVYKKDIKKAIDLGTRSTFADTAATIAELFGIDENFGATSYLKALEG